MQFGFWRRAPGTTPAPHLRPLFPTRSRSSLAGTRTPSCAWGARFRDCRLPWMLRLINHIPWKVQLLLTTLCAVLMLVNGVMTLVEALDCWFERLGHPADDAGRVEFYAEHYDDAYYGQPLPVHDDHADDSARVDGRRRAEAVRVSTSPRSRASRTRRVRGRCDLATAPTGVPASVGAARPSRPAGRRGGQPASRCLRRCGIGSTRAQPRRGRGPGPGRSPSWRT